MPETVVGKLVTQLVADFKGLKKDLKMAYKKISTFTKRVRKLTKRAADGFKLMGRAIRKMSKGVTRYAKWMGIAIVAALTLSIKEAISFEKQLANVSTMLVEHTMKLLPTYAKRLHELSIKFGESTKTLASGLYNILSASIAPTKAMKVLGITAVAAAAGLTETNAAAYAITGILKAYGMAADKAARVSDILFATVKRGQTNFAKLAPTIGRVTAISASAGIGLEEVGAALATITRGGISTEEAITGLRMALISLQGNTPEAVSLAKKHGIELSVEALKTKGLIGMIKDLANLQPEVLKNLFKEIRARVVLSVLIKDQAGFLSDYNLTMNSAGLTQEAFEKQSRTTAFALNRMWQAIKMVAEAIGNSFLPLVREASDAIREWLIDHKDAIADFVGKIVDDLTVFLHFLKNDWRAGVKLGLSISLELFKGWGKKLAILLKFIAQEAADSFMDAFLDRMEKSPTAKKVSGFLDNILPGRARRRRKQAAMDEGVRILLGKPEGWQPGDGEKDARWAKTVTGITAVGKATADAIEAMLKPARDMQKKGLEAWEFLQAEMDRFFPNRLEFSEFKSTLENPFQPPRLSATPGTGDDLENTAKEIETTYNQVASSIKFAFEDAFTSAIMGAESLKDVLKGFANDILRTFSRGLSTGLSNMLFGTGTDKPGLLGGVMQGIGALLMGNSTPFAEGGIVTRPTLAMIGERHKPEAVIPLEKLEGLTGGGGVTINIINPWDGRSVMRAIESKAVEAVLRDQGANGPVRTMIRGNE